MLMVACFLSWFWLHSRCRNTYVNHWESPTYMASIEDKSMNGGGYALKQMIWNAARDTIRYASREWINNCDHETFLFFPNFNFCFDHFLCCVRNDPSEWTGQQLAECSLYGIRIYKEGAVLATHVDRLPLVSSAIINVDQDVDEPW
jgi:prolyl 4-hydroxylase